jgi:type II secretory pathway pseudopilin PulG
VEVAVGVSNAPFDQQHTLPTTTSFTMVRVLVVLALLIAAASAFVTPANHAGE